MEGTIVVVHIQPPRKMPMLHRRIFCFQQRTDIISNVRDLTLATCTFANRFKCVGVLLVLQNRGAQTIDCH